MSLKLNERYPNRFSNPTTQYPQGAFKNRSAPGAQDGSYLEKDWANDMLGFFSRLLSQAGITPNGSVDTATSSQYFDAMIQSVKNNLGTAAQRNVGNTATNQIPDMSFFQTTNNNVFRFPNGLMIQAFGVLPSASSTTTSFVFPVAFPNNVIVINANYNTGNSINIYAFNNLTKTGGDMRVYVPTSATPTTGGGTAAILAVGF